MRNRVKTFNRRIKNRLLSMSTLKYPILLLLVLSKCDTWLTHLSASRRMMRWTACFCLTVRVCHVCVYTLSRVCRYSSTRTTAVVLYTYHTWCTRECACTHCNARIRIIRRDRDASCSWSCRAWLMGVFMLLLIRLISPADTKFSNLVARLLRGSDTAVPYLDLPSQDLSIRHL